MKEMSITIHSIGWSQIAYLYFPLFDQKIKIIYFDHWFHYFFFENQKMENLKDESHQFQVIRYV